MKVAYYCIVIEKSVDRDGSRHCVLVFNEYSADGRVILEKGEQITQVVPVTRPEWERP